MDCSIVYLKPVGAGGYRAELRSDTLWAALCWALRSVYDESTLTEILKAYTSGVDSAAFYLSSAFPYLEEEGDKVCFFPAPLLPFRQSELLTDIESMSPEEIKLAVRKDKKRLKQQAYLTQSHFEYLISGREASWGPKEAPAVVGRPMTHNTISRLTGSTLTIKENEEDEEGSGQLFHTDEFYLKGENTGLFFLLKGNLEIVKPALRFIEHEGLGGDRSTGKGRFQVSEPEAFHLHTPSDANAIMSLSLYHPTEAELAQWPGPEKRLLNYKLESRLGRTHLQKQHLHDRPLLFFKEGSSFPKYQNGKSIYGLNAVTGKHAAGFDIQRYGYGFMVDVKIL